MDQIYLNDQKKIWEKWFSGPLRRGQDKAAQGSLKYIS